MFFTPPNPVLCFPKVGSIRGMNGVDKVLFKAEFSSSLGAMAEVLDQAVGRLAQAGSLCVKDTQRMRLCLEEAMANAVLHGNQGDARRKVRIEIVEQGDGACRIRIFDEGGGFHPEAIQAPEGEQMGGRGVCLMRHYMDTVRFNRQEHCLEMVFRCNTATKEHETHE